MFYDENTRCHFSASTHPIEEAGGIIFFSFLSIFVLVQWLAFVWAAMCAYWVRAFPTGLLLTVSI